eukprot:5265453-Pyramimonas_sp.AAC.1
MGPKASRISRARRSSSRAGDFPSSQRPFQPSQFDRIEQERPPDENSQTRSARRPRGRSRESCRRSPAMVNA